MTSHLDQQARSLARSRRNWQKLTAGVAHPPGSTGVAGGSGIGVGFTGSTYTITNLSPGSTFYVAAGNSGISTSTVGDSTYVYNTQSMSGGSTDVYSLDASISTSTNGNSVGVMVNLMPVGSGVPYPGGGYLVAALATENTTSPGVGVLIDGYAITQNSNGTLTTGTIPITGDNSIVPAPGAMAGTIGIQVNRVPIVNVDNMPSTNSNQAAYYANAGLFLTGDNPNQASGANIMQYLLPFVVSASTNSAASLASTFGNAFGVAVIDNVGHSTLSASVSLSTSTSYAVRTVLSLNVGAVKDSVLFTSTVPISTLNSTLPLSISMLVSTGANAAKTYFSTYLQSTYAGQTSTAMAPTWGNLYAAMFIAGSSTHSTAMSGWGAYTLNGFPYFQDWFQYSTGQPLSATDGGNNYDLAIPPSGYGYSSTWNGSTFSVMWHQLIGGSETVDYTNVSTNGLVYAHGSTTAIVGFSPNFNLIGGIGVACDNATIALTSTGLLTVIGGSTFYVIGSTGISTSTNGLSTYIFNTQSTASGGVTSVGLALPGMFAVSGTPVTSTGTLTATLANELQYTVLAGPTSASAAPPTFRTLVAGDIPGGLPYVTSVSLAGPAIFSISGSPVTSAGTLTISLVPEPTNSVFAGPAAGGAANPTFRALVAADLASVQYVSSIVGSTGISTSTNGLSTYIFNTEAPGSTFYVAGSTGISTSTNGLSTYIFNTAPFASTAVYPVVASDPASPTNGQAWYNSTTFTTKEQLLSTGSYELIGSEPHVLIATGGQQVQCTTGAGSFTNPNFIIPAGLLNVAGRTIRVSLKLLTSFGVANNLTIYPFTLNNTVGLFGTNFTTSQEAFISGYVTTLTTGASGTVYAFFTVASPTGFTFGAGATETVNLTSTISVTNAFACTASTATDYIVQDMFLVELLG